MPITIVDTLGNIKKWIINACDVQLLDTDGKFKSKNLEDAMKEIGSGTEENMIRIENELTTARGANDNLNDRLELDKTGILNTIGSEDLTTDAQNIKGAVNEINTQLSEKANNSDATRTTTDKTVTGAINELNANKLNKTSVVNNLTANVAGSALDAMQGKILQTQIANIFLSQLLITNANDAPVGLCHNLDSNITNGAFLGTWTTFLTLGTSTATMYKQQIAISWGGLGIKLRTCENGTWSAWKSITIV